MKLLVERYDEENSVANSLYIQVCEVSSQEEKDEVLYAIETAYEDGDIDSPEYDDLRVQLDKIWPSYGDDDDDTIEEELNEVLGLKE